MNTITRKIDDAYYIFQTHDEYSEQVSQNLTNHFYGYTLMREPGAYGTNISYLLWKVYSHDFEIRMYQDGVYIWYNENTPTTPEEEYLSIQRESVRNIQDLYRLLGISST